MGQYDPTSARNLREEKEKGPGNRYRPILTLAWKVGLPQAPCRSLRSGGTTDPLQRLLLPDTASEKHPPLRPSSSVDLRLKILCDQHFCNPWPRGGFIKRSELEPTAGLVVTILAWIFWPTIVAVVV